MAKLALVFVALFSFNTFASTAKVNPAKPIVISADFRNESGEYIQAPWIRANFTVDATETITLTGVRFTIKSKGGYTQIFHWYLPKGGVEVASGASYTLPLAYVYNLGPVSETEFNVHMDFEGWVGKANAPTGRLSLAADFVTQ